MKLIKTGELKPKKEDGFLYLAVEGDSPEQLLSPAAKQLAWAARCDYGFEKSGIERYTSPMIRPASSKSKSAKTKYATVYRLTINQTL